MIRSAKVVDPVERASPIAGVERATANMKGVRQRKREMVDGMIAIHRKTFAVPDLEFLLGEGRLVGPRTVEARLPEVACGGWSATAFPESRHATDDPWSFRPGRAEPLTHVEALDSIVFRRT